MRIIGDGRNRIPFVHIDDVVPAFRLALSRGRGVYVLAGEGLPQERVFAIAAGELGVRPPGKRMPRWLAMLAAGAGELLYRLGGKAPALSKEHVAVLSYDRTFDCKKARRELGFSPRPLAHGITEMARSFREWKLRESG
jgi:nucleoside-diphosphate-sugar epimerase